MRILTASDPARTDRDNEDFVAADAGAMVLLDGAGIPGTEAICAHGVAWYSRMLGGRVLRRMTHASRPGLAAALADSTAAPATSPTPAARRRPSP